MKGEMGYYSIVQPGHQNDVSQWIIQRVSGQRDPKPELMIVVR
jgi:hypothetical protein